MSLITFAIIVCAIVTLPVFGITAALRYLRRGQPKPERPPEKWYLRVVYALVAPILAFAIAIAIIFLLFAGSCGLEFGFGQGLIVLELGGILIPLLVALLAFGFALWRGRQVVLVECALAALTAVVICIYGLVTQPTATTLPAHCQIQGP
jgi:hypothetical protein